MGEKLVHYLCTARSTYKSHSPTLSKRTVKNFFHIPKCLNLNNIKYRSQNTISIRSTPKKPCTLMLLNNLAEPDWVSIGCHEKLLFFVLCVKRKETNRKILKTSVKPAVSVSCKTGEILVQENCAQFTWHLNGKQGRLFQQCVNPLKFKNLNFIFDAIFPFKIYS